MPAHCISPGMSSHGPHWSGGAGWATVGVARATANRAARTRAASTTDWRGMALLLCLSVSGSRSAASLLMPVESPAEAEPDDAAVGAAHEVGALAARRGAAPRALEDDVLIAIERRAHV